MLYVEYEQYKYDGHKYERRDIQRKNKYRHKNSDDNGKHHGNKEMNDPFMLHERYLVEVLPQYLLYLRRAAALFQLILNVFHIICKIFGHIAHSLHAQS